MAAVVMTVGMVGMVGGTLDNVAASAAKIRLTTSLAPVLQSSAEGVRLAAYTVTVCSRGGTARDTRLAVTTQRPAQWSIFPSTCQAAASKNQVARLSCALGEVTGSAKVTMTLQLPTETRIPGGLGVHAVADATNAAKRSKASAVVPLQPLAINASAPMAATPSVPATSPAMPSVPAMSSVPPTPSVPGTPSVPAAAGTADSPARTPARAAAVQQHAVKHAVKKHAHAVPKRAVPKRAVPKRAVPKRAVPKRAVPKHAVEKGPWLPTMNPKAPMPPITPAPVVPRVPFVMPEATPAIDAPQLPAARPPTVPQLPVVSPKDGGAQTRDDNSPMSLTTVPPQTDRQGSWAMALAVVVVAQAAVLWLAASLGLWRRRLLLGQAVGNGVRRARLLRPAATLLRRVPLLRLTHRSKDQSDPRVNLFRR